MWLELAVTELVIGVIICIILESKWRRKKMRDIPIYESIFYVSGLFLMLFGFALLIFGQNEIGLLGLGFAIYGAGIALISLGISNRSERKIMRKLTDLENKMSLIVGEKNQGLENK